MKKALILSTIVISLFSGCGGGGDRDTNLNNNSISGKSNDKNSYNLWNYFTPANSKTNNYRYYEGNKVSSYKSSYSVSETKVVEIDNYAPNEKTIYEKMPDYIKVSFEKNGKPNGLYKLKFYANIGDSVTVIESGCKLTKHYDNFSLKGENFNDVIEIRCDDKPGYYQKNVGEIAQEIQNKNQKSIRVLAN